MAFTSHIYRLILTNKVREIYFKILHRYYFIFERLRKDIETSFSFCSTHPETIACLFWTCAPPTEFWSDVLKFLQGK